jgi:hypothetical protein
MRPLGDNDDMDIEQHTSPFGTRAIHVAAVMAVAVAIALAAPGRADGNPEDAVADGILAAQHCDAEVGRGMGRWADCIRRQEDALAASTQAALGLHFQAWLTADQVARAGKPAASDLRAAHAHRVVQAIDGNVLTLHRLCTASGLDCDEVGERLGAVL